MAYISKRLPKEEEKKQLREQGVPRRYGPIQGFDLLSNLHFHLNFTIFILSSPHLNMIYLYIEIAIDGYIIASGAQIERTVI